MVIDGVAKIIKTGADVYEGLIVGRRGRVAVAFSQTEERGTGPRFFAGGLGLRLVAVNLSPDRRGDGRALGPTLPGRERPLLEGPYLGVWTACRSSALWCSCAVDLTRDCTADLSPSVWRSTVVAMFWRPRSWSSGLSVLTGLRPWSTRSVGKSASSPAGRRVVDLSGTDRRRRLAQAGRRSPAINAHVRLFVGPHEGHGSRHAAAQALTCSSALI